MVGVGANSVDYVYRLPASPRADSPTAKLRITSHRVSCGGQMATALSACAALGLRAAYVGAIGTDDNGRRIRQELAGRGIDLSHVVTRDGTNQFAVITVDETTGERIVLWDRDERLMLQPADVPAGLIASARLVHVDDVDEVAAIRAATLAREAGVPVDERPRSRHRSHAGAGGGGQHSDLRRARAAGDHRRGRLRAGARQAAAHARRPAVRHAGAARRDAARRRHGCTSNPGSRCTAVDTTGAGDVFRAGFIHALLSGAAPREILRFANAAAALSCTRAGALDGVPVARRS